MYKVEPVFGDKNIVLQGNMHYVEPIADSASANSGFLDEYTFTQIAFSKLTF